MKLENNSLRYGTSVHNNATSAYNSAYQQEMENQRNMQSQVTQRQRTLLDAINSENAYKQAERDRAFGYGSQTGYGGRPAPTEEELQTYTDNFNKLQSKNTANYANLSNRLANSMPNRIVINPIDGTPMSLPSDQGYSYVNNNVLNSNMVANEAALRDKSPYDVATGWWNNHSAGLPQWYQPIKRKNK